MLRITNVDCLNCIKLTLYLLLLVLTAFVYMCVLLLKWLNTVFFIKWKIHYLVHIFGQLLLVKKQMYLFHKSYTTAVAMASFYTMFQDGGYFGFKVI